MVDENGRQKGLPWLVKIKFSSYNVWEIVVEIVHLQQGGRDAL